MRNPPDLPHRRGPSSLRTHSLRPLGILLVAGWLAGCGSGASESTPSGDGYPTPRPAAAAPSRTFDLSWTIVVNVVPETAETAVLWIAIPPDLEMQSVAGLEVDTGFPWEMVEDPDFHNRVVRVTVLAPPESLAVTLTARVTRLPVMAPIPASLSEAERRLYLREEGLVSISPRIHALADSVGGDSRSRYDYVLDLMSYDKSVPGWGNGDSERACNVRKGNCTDFHSLFMSLSRAEGVPAVFEMGYPTLPEGETNRAGGYHCWAYFYDDAARAWVSVDISEADKHLERSEFFYGHLDADRITFSRGRGIRLPGMQGEPLNYLPAGAYVEVDGAPHEAVTRTLTYTVAGEAPGS